MTSITRHWVILVNEIDMFPLHEVNQERKSGPRDNDQGRSLSCTELRKISEQS